MCTNTQSISPQPIILEGGSFHPKKATLSQLDKVINCLYIIKYFKQIQEIMTREATNKDLDLQELKSVNQLFAKAFKLATTEEIAIFPSMWTSITAKSMEKAICRFNLRYLELTSFEEESEQIVVSVITPQATNVGMQETLEILSHPKEAVSEKKLDWQNAHKALLEKIENRGVSPLIEDNPNVMREYVKDFIDVFDQTPNEKKDWLIHQSLYPKDTNPQWALPLNYIMFTGNFDALKKIEPFLHIADWCARGPYDSTFIHCVLSGIEKNCSSQGKPFKCIKHLVKKAPDLKELRNCFNTSPLQYLSLVKNTLQNNLENIQNYGGGGYGGLNKMSSIRDVLGGIYTESESDYEILQHEINQIREFLMN